MKCFVVGIKKGERRAVFAVLSKNVTRAGRAVLARYTGWEVEFVKPKTKVTVIRVYDDNWYEFEEES